MRVTLQVSSGPLAGRIIFLKAGQRAEVGRTEWADFTFPHDAQMAEVHFMVECQPDQCVIRDLETATGTFVNGQPIVEQRLRHGMEILAGQTRFQVGIDPPDGEVVPETGMSVSAGVAAVPNPSSSERLATSYCEMLELEEASQALLAENPRLLPGQFLARLLERGLLVDAIRFKAQTLPKRQAIWWALNCVRMMPDHSRKQEQNQQALSAVEVWLADPTEANRRNAEAAARTLNYETPAAWTAMTVFWSGGSLAPPDTEAVPPAEHLTAMAASAALLMAAASGPAIEVSERHRQFLAMADQKAPDR